MLYNMHMLSKIIIFQFLLWSILTFFTKIIILLAKSTKKKYPLLNFILHDNITKNILKNYFVLIYL